MDATMLARGLPLSLWGIWWNAILLLRPAFSRLRTFMWFVTAVAGLTVRVDLLGVTSIVRALNLRPRLYTKLLDHFHSSGLKLDRLSALWTQAVLQLFPSLVWVNNRLVLVGDGIKTPKRGKKMPAVKLLHQQSESNSKPDYIMGHSLQAVGLLVHAANSVFCVPLAVRIHEGLVWSNRDKRTLLDKMLGLLDILAVKVPFYFVVDAYYAAGKMVNGLLKQGNHLVTRVKSNAVAYAPATQKKGRRKKGRPKTYGKKIKLKSLLTNVKSMQQVASPVYGERNVTLRYRVCDLLWRPAGRLVRFVAVMHPTRGSCILMCTDTSLSAAEIIKTRCARHFPIFSWVPQKAILSRNSSPSAKTPKICGLSAWPREQKEVLLSENVSRNNDLGDPGRPVPRSARNQPRSGVSSHASVLTSEMCRYASPLAGRGRIAHLPDPGGA